MKKILPLLLSGTILALIGCESGTNRNAAAQTGSFQVVSESFADIRILRYRVPGFESLSLSSKLLLYYLQEAALSGRDMIWDQNFKHNLTIRRTLEALITSLPASESPEYAALMEYTKRVWFANGIHHHYNSDKFVPGFTADQFAAWVKQVPKETLPLAEGETVEAFIARLSPVLFDPAVAPKKVNKDEGVDLVTSSAVNFYEGVTQKEVEAFYGAKVNPGDARPVSWGLNSKLVKENGQVAEKVWKVGGMYSPAIEKVVYWLEKAAGVAQTPAQKASLDLLIAFYKTGDLKTFDDYSIAWVQDTASEIDVINGFIEVYNDPLGFKGSYESVVSIRDPEASKRIVAIGSQAQWFEDHSPILDSHKKKDVKGISARVINVTSESGDASPSTPIGINLPNANWIRADFGSKSVNLANIVDAYDEAARTSGGAYAEFAFSKAELDRNAKYGSLAGKLHTDMHEVIGHASGQINPGIGTPKETLKNYASTLEEARADLVALYFILDNKLIEMGLMESLEVAKAEYDRFILNGLMLQLTRVKPGKNIEEDHMRNRQLIAAWALEKGKADNVIEKGVRDGKTYVKINDYEKLRVLFGELLREIQRIKSEGDFEAGKSLVETYGVKVDPALHAEVLERYKKLNVPPFSGFINPHLVPVMKNGEITDITLTYPDSFMEQMLFYARNYSFLPHYN